MTENTLLSRLTGAVLTAAVLLATAACSARVERAATAAVPPSGPAVVFRFGDRAAAATLTDTPASRQFAAMLPLTVQLQDVWGQAKSGRLPGWRATDGETPVRNPTPGGIYVWPLSEVLAVYYDDLGQSVPEPGLIRLGAVDTGLDQLAAAGKRVTVRIDLAAA